VGLKQDRLIVIRRLSFSLFGARFARDSRGSMVVEFALMLPVMTALLLGMTEFGVLMYNKIEMTDASRIAAREFAIGRSQGTPRATAVARFYAAAPGIPNGSANITTKVSGAPCTDANCKAALDAAVGGEATFEVTRTCRLFTTYSILPLCSLRSSTSMRIE
jgi:Flp pilus assembly protein TadG